MLNVLCIESAVVYSALIWPERQAKCLLRSSDRSDHDKRWECRNVTWCLKCILSGVYRKNVAALEPGCIILIHVFILDDSKDGHGFPALFALNILVGMAMPNDSSVISGVKKGN